MTDDTKKKEEVNPGGQKFPQQPDVKVNMDETVGKGDYANFVRIQHTAMDFRLDFAKALPDENTLNVVSRLFMSPIHTKMFLKALDDNIKKYEAQFGPIELTPNAGSMPLPSSTSKVTH